MYVIRTCHENDFPNELVWNSSLRIIFIVSGDLQLQSSTTIRHLNQHDITFIKPYELHGACSSINGCTAYSLEIRSDTLSILCPEIDKIDFSISILKATDKYSTYSSICKSLAQVFYYNGSGELNSTARAYSAISDIISLLIEDFSNGLSEEHPSDQTFTRIRLIMDYIRNNYSHKISLEDISYAIGFHPQYFSAYFKKLFSTSFTDYLNSFRVSKSAVMLTESNESVLNIALSCGFNNHKTFNNAFEKVYSCSPREYRKRNHIKSSEDTVDVSSSDFNYLKRFWNNRDSEQQYFETQLNQCNIIIDNNVNILSNSSHNIASIGRAISCLRSDMQEQLKKAKADLDIEYVRIRDIFSDDLFVYYEDKDKIPSYSWRTLDQIFDFLLSCGIKPFIEIGFTPEQLSSKKQYAGWQYHPNVSIPKSIKQWEQLVENFIIHLCTRYGENSVSSWLFDFWTAPNIQVENGYWNETLSDFFRFYESTFNAAKKAHPDIVFGSANFSLPSGFDCYEQFFRYAVDHNAVPDFLSVHLYSCGDGQINNSSEFMQYHAFDNNYRIPNITPKRDEIPDNLDKLHDILSAYKCPDIPIVVDDWNVTFFPTDYTRDTCFMAPYIVENYFRCFDKAFGMGFASLSDIHEDFFNTDQLYGGGPGLLTYNGIPKASYLGMKAASRFSKKICQLGKNYAVGITDTGYEILIYNTDFYSDDYVGNNSSVISFSQRYNVFESVPDLSCHIEIPTACSKCSITRTLISRQNGSSYDAWVSMGSPAPLTPDMADYLKQISVPSMNYQTMNVSGKLSFDEIVEPHSVLHIDIRKLD